MIPDSINSKDQIEKLQKELSKLGYSIRVDGVWGTETETAGKKFQADNGLNSDGKVGLETGALLNDKYGQAVEAELARAKQALEGIRKWIEWVFKLIVDLAVMPLGSIPPLPPPMGEEGPKIESQA